MAADLYGSDEEDAPGADGEDEDTDDDAILAGVLDSDDEEEEEEDEKNARTTGRKGSDKGDGVVVDALALQDAIVSLNETLESKGSKKTLKEKRKEKKAAGGGAEEHEESNASKKGQKGGKGAVSTVSSGAHKKTGVVYLGRIPHGFYEKEMKAYFSQFGDVLRLRLSRNKKTGASKHYAFIEFPSPEIAKIVAETMQGYLLFNHILQCKVVAPESLHPETFKGHDRRFKVMPWNKMERQRVNRELTAKDVEVRTKRLLSKEVKKRQQLKDIGIDYE
ncbi:hypothetical protein BC830DRAFT_1057354, partial [Chytriomyces sp. MP71]